MKCLQLGVTFKEYLEQQSTLTGSLLSKFIPWQTSRIGMDGNCFFRCLSKIIADTEEHHAKLRAETYRYMVTDGKPIINRYLKTFNKDLSLISYLKTSAMTEDGIWATDVEVMARACMLDSDVFIATEQHDAKKLQMRVIWNRYSGCIEFIRDPQNICLYISNPHQHHYEPVIRLINSNTIVSNSRTLAKTLISVRINIIPIPMDRILKKVDMSLLMFCYY